MLDGLGLGASSPPSLSTRPLHDPVARVLQALDEARACLTPRLRSGSLSKVEGSTVEGSMRVRERVEPDRARRRLVSSHEAALRTGARTQKQHHLHVWGVGLPGNALRSRAFLFSGCGMVPVAVHRPSSRARRAHASAPASSHPAPGSHIHPRRCAMTGTPGCQALGGRVRRLAAGVLALVASFICVVSADGAPPPANRSWTIEGPPVDSTRSRGFAPSLSLDGDRLAVGAPGDYDVDAEGRAIPGHRLRCRLCLRALRRRSGRWKPGCVAPATAPGRSLSAPPWRCPADTLLVGAPGDDVVTNAERHSRRDRWRAWRLLHVRARWNDTWSYGIRLEPELGARRHRWRACSSARVSRMVGYITCRRRTGAPRRWHG